MTFHNFHAELFQIEYSASEDFVSVNPHTVRKSIKRRNVLIQIVESDRVFFERFIKSSNE